MIDVVGVSKAFGRVRAVTGATFRVAEARAVGLLGPNGAGKSTTLRMITGFLPPSAGRISVGGHDTIDQSMQARRLIGYLPDAAPFYPEMRVRDYITHRARLYGMARADRRKAVAAAIDRCWLGDVASRRVGQLSKGFKQRVGLAAALVHDPRVLILDEPTSGLDPTQIREMRELLRELSGKRTVLVSSHILPEVERTCDEVIVIAGGRIRAQGTPASLITERSALAPYEWRVTTDKAARASELAGRVGGVVRVEQSAATATAAATNNETVLLIHPRPDEGDLRPALAQAAHEAGLVLLGHRRIEPTLEDVFVSLVEQEGDSGHDADARNANNSNNTSNASGEAAA